MKMIVTKSGGLAFYGAADGDVDANAAEMASALYLQALGKALVAAGFNAQETMRTLAGDAMDGESASDVIAAVEARYPDSARLGVDKFAEYVVNKVRELS